MSAPKPRGGVGGARAPRVHVNSGADRDRVGATTTIVVVTSELSRFSLDCPELARALAAGVEHLEVGRDLSWEDVIHSAMRRS